jgi:hypothetical protein
MRKVLALLAILTLVGTASAADIARGPEVVEGIPTEYQDDYRGTDVLIISIIEGIFTDLAPIYAGAFEANGWTASIAYDPMGNWDPTDYDMVLYSTSDNWWNSYPYSSDLPVAGAYMDAGGCMVVVGQDFLYGSEGYGGLVFLQTYFDVNSVIQDVNFGDESAMQWFGNPMSILYDISDVMLPCFEANPWFTDDVIPNTQGIADWCTDTACGEGGSQTPFSMFSVIEFGCGAVVKDVVLRWMDFCKPPTPTEETSWGQIKNLYH